MRELRVEDALMYLDQVKMEFGDRPHIYNEFLDIMKTFKSQQIDTPGVIQRVSALFHGNKRLVLGFNTFLPEGYKIEIPLDGNGLAVYREPGRREAIQITWPGMAEHLALQQQRELAQQQAVAGATAAAKSPASPPAAAGAPRPSPPPAAQPPASVGPHVEFGHAINYVTTIKKRFASSPEIYRKFLEILHTYQKEQRGIKEVLDEVSSLFADHADLLKEFTYFLPDAVQGVAKKQLDQAAAKAEERMRLRQQQAQLQGGGVKLPKEESRVPAAHVKRVPFGATAGRSENEETDIRKGVVNGIVHFDPVRPPRRHELTPAQTAHLYGRPKSIPSIPIEPNITETELVAKIKTYFDKKDAEASNKPTGKKTNSYQEFIKLLHLFGIGLLTKDELVQLLRGLFGKASPGSTGVKPNQLLMQVEKMMGQRGPLRKKPRTNQASSEDTTVVTPSYHLYPPNYIFDAFSGETEQDKRVINYKVFLCKEEERKALEDYDGVRWRKNVHEGVLNRVEDEMYEVDIAIERNAQTLKVLQPIAEEMTKLKDMEEKAGQPIGRLQYKLKPRSLNSVHIGAIARIYGDQGDEVIQHLLRNPFMVLPILYERMMAKGEEWKKAKEELMKEWKAEIKQHHDGSLDVKSYFYKVALEKSLTDDILMEECEGIVTSNQDDIQKVEFNKDPNPKMFLFRPYLSISLHNMLPNAYEKAYKFLSSHILGDVVARVWNNFVFPLLGLSGDEAVSDLYTAGQRVKTTIDDDGIILSGKTDSLSRYLVKFPFGVGLVRPNAILEVQPSGETSQDVATQPEMLVDMQVLFGTKDMYIALRLINSLAKVLSELFATCSESEYNTLVGLASGKDSDTTEYEAQCRKILGTKPRMHVFLNLPFLLKRCTDTILRISKEDVFIRLSHLSQLQLKDLNHLRSLSLKVTKDAAYRIQFSSNKLFFNYLPHDEDLHVEESTAGPMEPESKRQKTDEMMEHAPATSDHHSNNEIMCASFVKALVACYFIGASSTYVKCFPISRSPSVVANHNRCLLGRIMNALPPSIDEDVDTAVGPDKGANIGQMELVRRTLFAELEKMRNQFTEMSESLNRVKEREEKAQGTIATLKEQQRSAELEKEEAIGRKKSEFIQEVTDISDELEGAQDNLRQTILKTRSEITDIQRQAKETEGRLRSEVADLESRLELLRQEAVNAVKARDNAIEQTKNEIENIQTVSRKEMRDAKNDVSAGKKAIKRDNYAQETRIQQAEMDLMFAKKEQELAAQEAPKISTLQNALDNMKSRMEPQVTEMKERRSANLNFFAVSRQSLKTRLEDELTKMESEFKTAQSTEYDNLQQSISSFESKLESKEKDLVNKLRLSNERADRAVAEAISAAKKNRIKLYEEKFNAVQDQQHQKRIAIQEALLTQTSVQDRYDAELENEIFILEEEKVNAEQRLEEQERFREDQNRDLLQKIEQLTKKMAQQIKDEKEAADEDLRLLRIAKGDELASSRARTKKALNDIQTTKSNLLLLQDMLKDLEVTDQETSVVLQRLEGERSSFRKQLKRTAIVAIDKLTLKYYRSKRTKREDQ